MKTLFRLVAATLSVALLAACSDGVLTPRSAPLSTVSSQRQARPIAPSNAGGPTLYVLNSGGQAFGVTVYSGGGASLLRTISFGKYSDGFTVDPSGHLYVGFPTSQGDPAGPGLLNIYSNRGVKVERTLQQPHPFALPTLDGSGNLFTYCAASRLCEYADAKQQVIRRIALRHFNSGGSALAVDASGNLAVDSPTGPILVFAPGATQPSWKFTSGLDYSSFLAFDSSGDLYAANFGANDQDAGSVTVYAQGTTSPIRTITNGVVKPSSLAFDRSGNLYVLNGCTLTPSGGCSQLPAVTVYAPGGSTPIRTVTNSVEGSGGLSLDPSGNLYVANVGYRFKSPPDPGSVAVYAPGSSSPMRTVTSGIQNPRALGIGP